MRTITLDDATPERLRIDFQKQFCPMAPGTNPGIQFAEYVVDPAACAILSTSKASVCEIVLPSTEEGHRVHELTQSLMQRQAIADVTEAKSLFADIEA